MAGINARQDQINFINNLQQQGILDNIFDNIIEIRNGGDAQFVIESINLFFTDTEARIPELDRFLNEPVIDYQKVSEIGHLIKGTSASMGGCRVALASHEFRYACEEMNKERCFEIFNRVKEEYQTLKEKFNIILQMERAIIANESSSSSSSSRRRRWRRRNRN